MTGISNIVEAEQVLAGYMPQVKELLGKDLTLTRMQPLMKLLGNPQDKLKIIHLAGTSGKTSTAYFIASLLTASGQKVGLTVSPHIDSVTERVQINLKPLPETEFCQALSEFLGLIENHTLNPTYFELLIAFAYWYFAKSGVDYAVIETGLGGLQDATNVAGREDKICVITDIGYDHMQVLGSSIEEIAAQKAGIIHPHNHVFMYQQAAEVKAVFEDQGKAQHAVFHTLEESEERSHMMIPDALKHLPAYQQRNWLLAYETYEFMVQRDKLPRPTWQDFLATLKVRIPGRMDIVKLGAKTVVMDGAHNAQKMQAFVSSFQSLYPGQKAAILLGMKSDKNYQDTLRLLKPICSQLIITAFEHQQDLPIEAADPETLAGAARRAGFEAITVEPDPLKAARLLLDSHSKLLIITGSFYLLSRIRPAIIHNHDTTHSSHR